MDSFVDLTNHGFNVLQTRSYRGCAGERERSGPLPGSDDHGSRCGTARCDGSTSVPGLERCADLLPSSIDELGPLRLVHIASKFSDEVDEAIMV